MIDMGQILAFPVPVVMISFLDFHVQDVTTISSKASEKMIIESSVVVA